MPELFDTGFPQVVLHIFFLARIAGTARDCNSEKVLKNQFMQAAFFHGVLGSVSA
jgi:hypothetical protein